MPFGVRAQQCTDSQGNRGSYVVYRRDTGASVSCHKTRTSAEAARRIRTARSEGKSWRQSLDWVSSKQLVSLVIEYLSKTERTTPACEVIGKHK